MSRGFYQTRGSSQRSTGPAFSRNIDRFKPLVAQKPKSEQKPFVSSTPIDFYAFWCSNLIGFSKILSMNMDSENEETATKRMVDFLEGANDYPRIVLLID